MSSTLTLTNDPNVRYRIDSFEVPAASRMEFDTAMKRNLSFIQTMPGFRGHMVFEKISGPSTFNVVTLAAWQDQAALDSAGERVRDYYKSIGFDMASVIARWGVHASIGNYASALDAARDAPAVTNLER